MCVSHIIVTFKKFSPTVAASPSRRTSCHVCAGHQTQGLSVCVLGRWWGIWASVDPRDLCTPKLIKASHHPACVHAGPACMHVLISPHMSDRLYRLLAGRVQTHTARWHCGPIHNDTTHTIM